MGQRAAADIPLSLAVRIAPSADYLNSFAANLHVSCNVVGCQADISQRSHGMATPQDYVEREKINCLPQCLLRCRALLAHAHEHHLHPVPDADAPKPIARTPISILCLVLNPEV
eukprot:87916-Rhodomonas_salina.1